MSEVKDKSIHLICSGEKVAGEPEKDAEPEKVGADTVKIAAQPEKLLAKPEKVGAHTVKILAE